MKDKFWLNTTFDKRCPLMKNLWWTTTFDGRHPLMGDNLWWKTTFYGIQPLMEDDLWWKTTFDGRWTLMEDNLWLKTTFNGDLEHTFFFDTKYLGVQNHFEAQFVFWPKIFSGPKFFRLEKSSLVTNRWTHEWTNAQTDLTSSYLELLNAAKNICCIFLLWY